MPRLRPPGPRMTPPEWVYKRLEILEASSLSKDAKMAGRLLLLNALVLHRCRYPMPPRSRKRVRPGLDFPFRF